MASFLIISLPRSRSAWLASFLCYHGKSCGHDLIVDCASLHEFEMALARHDGSCETGAVVGWKMLAQRQGLRLFAIHRPVGEIVDSLRRNGLEPDVEVLEQRAEMLAALSRVARVRSFSFAQLDEEEVCREIFESCLGLEWDRDWWLAFRNANIQIDFASRVRKLAARRAELGRFTEEIISRSAQLGESSCLRLN